MAREGIKFIDRENYQKQRASVFHKNDKKVVFDINDLSQENIDFIFEIDKKTRIFINKATFELTTENIEKIFELEKYVKNQYKSEIKFNDSGWSVSKVFYATSLLEIWAKEINEAKVDGRALSPYEKFLYAYQIVTQFEYKKEKKQNLDSRDIVRIINNNFKEIVCVGYAELLAALCKLIGIECETQEVMTKNENTNGLKNDLDLGEHSERLKINHENCVFELHDEVYGIDGVYYCDPCWDSRKENKRTYHHAHIKFSEVEDIFDGDVHTEHGAEVKQFIDKAIKLGCLESSQLINGNNEWEKHIAWRSRHPVKEEAVGFILTQSLAKIKEIRKSMGIDSPQSSSVIQGYPGCLTRLIEISCLWWAEKESGVSNGNVSCLLEGTYESELVELLASCSDDKIEDYLRRQAFPMISQNGLDRLKVNEELITWVEQRRNPTKITGFETALTNIFIAKGMNKDLAEFLAKRAFEQSVEACQQSMKLFPYSNSIFIEEAYNRILERQNEIE